MIESPLRIMCEEQWLDDARQLKALVKWIPDGSCKVSILSHSVS